MKNYNDNWKFSSLVLILLGLMETLGSHPAIGPIMIASGIIVFVTFNLYKTKKQIDRTVYSFIIIATLVGMLIGEYFIVPVQNTIFYALLSLSTMGIFLTFYFSLISKDRLTKRAKILSWTGSILFLISFMGILGLIQNDFRLSLSLGIIILIVILVSLIIRRRLSEDNEFNEVYTTKRNINDNWFKYEIGGIPKPIRWQGWACYGIFLASPFLVLIFVRDPVIATVIIVAIIFIVMLVAMLKSNYRESVREYRINLKK